MDFPQTTNYRPQYFDGLIYKRENDIAVCTRGGGGFEGNAGSYYELTNSDHPALQPHYKHQLLRPCYVINGILMSVGSQPVIRDKNRYPDKHHVTVRLLTKLIDGLRHPAARGHLSLSLSLSLSNRTGVRSVLIQSDLIFPRKVYVSISSDHLKFGPLMTDEAGGCVCVCVCVCGGGRTVLRGYKGSADVVT